MLEEIFTIDDVQIETLTIQKSKFIAYAYKFDSSLEIKNIIAELKKQEKGATHYCYAFKFLTNIRSDECFMDSGEEVTGYDDDGEPTGTAGMKILRAICEKNASNVLVVVVRYFGGIKLGVGGLGRAYKDVADLVLGKLKHKKLMKIAHIETDYSNFEKLKTMEETKNIKISNTTFDSIVAFDLTFGDADKKEIEKVLGFANFDIVGNRYL